MEINIDNVFVEIDYTEFKNKINSKESFIFYLGGEWCKNCRPVSPLIKQVAISNNIKIFNLDSRNGNKEPIDDFRKCNNNFQETMYKEFIQLLGYHNDDTVCIEDDFFNIRDTYIPKLSVPAVMAIKDGIVIKMLIEEYEQDDITIDIENYYKEELKVLIDKL